MPTKSRALTLADVARITAIAREATDPGAVYAAIERVAGETCGFVLLTTLRYDEAAGVVVRLHSSDPVSYPVGGTKPLDQLTENQRIMDRGDVAFAPTKADVKRLFFDHELIFSLGITAILNAPIRHAGRRLGTLNFCGLENTYGPAETETAQVLAALLVPTLLSELAAVASVR
jgi:GAF domain-containing protein